ncbi:MAG: flagellar biosynthesis anti-sigma factor FlgM [Lachnospiraceae bacterium]|nr:flagellar biosynthesis anti-sigma factor FlgM [Lachnospiraceae bacterium]
MRIDGIGAINQVYKANNAYKTQTASAAYSTDQVELSSFGKELQIAKAAVAATSDVRADKVADIKARLSAGTYQVSAADIASKLVDNIASEFEL